MSSMIFLDTETTGLLKPDAAEMQYQPHMTEFCGVKVDFETLEQIDALEYFCKIPVPVPEFITKITGINDEMLANEKPFVYKYDEMCEFFLGTKYVVAHNLMFDLRVLYDELERIDRSMMFPWPFKWICTVEASMPIEHRRLRLPLLHEHYYGHVPAKSHRAYDDVHTLIKCYSALRKDGLVD